MDQNLGVFQTMKQPTSLKKIANGLFMPAPCHQVF